MVAQDEFCGEESVGGIRVHIELTTCGINPNSGAYMDVWRTKQIHYVLDILVDSVL